MNNIATTHIASRFRLPKKKTAVNDDNTNSRIKVGNDAMYVCSNLTVNG